jgi:hypothetical protein
MARVAAQGRSKIIGWVEGVAASPVAIFGVSRRQANEAPVGRASFHGLSFKYRSFVATASCHRPVLRVRAG